MMMVLMNRVTDTHARRMINRASIRSKNIHHLLLPKGEGGAHAGFPGVALLRFPTPMQQDDIQLPQPRDADGAIAH